MKFINIFICLLFIIIFSSCFGKKTNEKPNSYNFTDSIAPVNNLYVDLSMENDTLTRKKEEGKIHFFFKIDDSIKLSLKDERRMFFIFTLISKDKKNKSLEKKIEKELKFSPVNPNDTIVVPFSVTPNFSGEATIIGIITDAYFLHSYNLGNKVRRIEYENMFEKDVFIK